jgi:hypothetical protein
MRAPVQLILMFCRTLSMWPTEPNLQRRPRMISQNLMINNKATINQNLMIKALLAGMHKFKVVQWKVLATYLLGSRSYAKRPVHWWWSWSMATALGMSAPAPSTFLSSKTLSYKSELTLQKIPPTWVQPNRVAYGCRAGRTACNRTGSITHPGVPT